MLQLLPDQEPRNMEYWDVIYSPEEEDLGEAYYVERLRELLKKPYPEDWWRMCPSASISPEVWTVR